MFDSNLNSNNLVTGNIIEKTNDAVSEASKLNPMDESEDDLGFPAVFQRMTDTDTTQHQYSKERLSSQYAPNFTDFVTVDEVSETALSKLTEITSKFPLPPNHSPHQQETVTASSSNPNNATTISNVSSSALKAMNIGFSSLRRGFTTNKSNGMKK